jgi:hypothetical protein
MRVIMFVLCLAPIGLILGVSVGVSEALNGISEENKGVASACLYMVRAICVSIGVSIMVSTSGISGRTHVHTIPIEALTGGYRSGALFCLIGLILTFLLMPHPAIPHWTLANEPLEDRQCRESCGPPRFGARGRQALKWVAS